MNSKEKRLKKLNNSGAALVTVIVVIAFASIFATVILYMSGVNYYMKTTDMNNKKSFYDGEKALEEIKARLMVDASEAFQKAYMLSSSSVASQSSADERQKTFNNAFVNYFEKNYKKKTSQAMEASDYGNYLKKAVNVKYSDLGGGTMNTLSVSGIDLSHKDEGYVVISGVELEYTLDGGNGYYTTRISTDYVIQAPKIDFSVMGNAFSAPGSEEVTKKLELADCVTYRNWTKK